MEKNEELDLVWDIVEKTGANIFLTGKAGTGKTTFLRELRARSPKRMIVLAPTGIAAINAGGVTIHSFFQLPLSPYVPGASFASGDQKRYKFGKAKRNILKTLDLLVIDEISMVRADLLDAIDAVMRRYRMHDRPFGGVQLLMIGDLQQLAPVVKDGEWELLKMYYDTPFFFSSRALNMAPYHTVELRKVYRQQDSRFLDILNKIRTNQADMSTLQELNRRYIPDFVPPKGEEYIRLTTHNHQAQDINAREMEALKGKEYVYKASVEGDFPENSYPADMELVLKEGAQVMFIKNAVDKSYYNGMIGEVAYADGRKVTVVNRHTGEEIDVEPAEWANSKYSLDEVTKEITETVEGVFRQLPLRQAWAITIHKSQGLTFEHAIIDASHSFAHGQTYVALSRCKSLEGLVLSRPLTASAIISDGTVDRFLAEAERHCPDAGMVSALEREYVVRLLDELFGFAMLKQAFDMTHRTLSEFFYAKYHMLLMEYEKCMPLIDSLSGVADRFAQQYRRIVEEGCPVDGEQLQTRIHKAAAYFAAEMAPLQQLVKHTGNVASTNKTAKAQLDERLAVLKELVRLKAALMDYESRRDVKFAVSDYLRRKAMVLLGDADSDSPAKRKAESAKKPAAKEQKRPSQEITHEMFTSGVALKEIAKRRNLSVVTVFRHLAQYVEGDVLPLDQLVSQEKIGTIMAYVRSHPDTDSLKQIKEALGDDISYDELRLVVKMNGMDV